MSVHQRQVVVGPDAYGQEEGWRAHDAGPVIVSSHPLLATGTATDAEGRHWLLLGDALRTRAGDDDWAADIRRSPTAAVAEVTEGWAGSWLLVGDGRILTDAAALLGFLYRPSAPVVGSTSVPLLRQLLEAAPADPGRRLRWGPGVNWYPPPGAPLEGVRRLLPSQALRVDDGAVEPRPLPTAPQEAQRPELLVGEAAATIMGGLRAVAARYDRVWVGLTSGHDSRLTLAAAAAAGLPVTAFTITFPGLAPADRTVPPRLAAAAGVPHRFVHWRRRAASSRLSAWDRHSGGATAEIDREFWARGLYDFAGPDDVVVRSGCFGVSKCHYWSALPPCDNRSLPTADVVLAGLRERPRPALSAAMGSWLRWAEQTPQAGMDWRDRLYLEQRLAGWLSGVEHALTLLPARSLNPANASVLYRTLQGFPSQTRQRVEHQRSITAALAPQLLDFPTNPPRSLPQRLRQRAYRSQLNTGRLLRDATRAVAGTTRGSREHPSAWSEA